MIGSSTPSPLRVLVVDDSPLIRRQIVEALDRTGEVQVVGEAADGEEALRLALTLKLDVITLDIEMPRMNGFAFLRILMAKKPTPVVVVSSHSGKENVFRALELGAMDFVEKPEQGFSTAASQASDQLREKVLLVRFLRNLARPPAGVSPEKESSPPAPVSVPRVPPRHVVAIASSTGGPSALRHLFGCIPARTSCAVLVAQHMPERFTRAFAERLNNSCKINVSEAVDNELVRVRCGFVCPGGKSMEVALSGSTGDLHLRVVPPLPGEAHVPNADRLFRSVAQAVGSRAIGIVLTGMGNDGLEGARAIRQASGQVVVESAETAIVYGMPAAVERAGLASQVLPLPAIGAYLANL